jgi:hypothetical protein
MAATTKESEPPAPGAYRLTVHRAQGIHWPVVCIEVESQETRFLHGLGQQLADQGLKLEEHRILFTDGESWWEVDMLPDARAGALRPLVAKSKQGALAELQARWQEDWDAMAADRKRLEAEVGE